MLQNVASCGGCTEAIPGRYPARITECCKTWDPVSGTRAVPGRYPGGTRAVPEAGLQNVTKRGILLEGTDAVPGRYPGGTRGGTTECCKTWDPAGGGTSTPLGF